MALFGKKREDKDISQVIDGIFDDNLDPSRKMMERIWYRNILYYIGEQYLEYDSRAGTFRKRTQSPFVPTPVSNIVGDYVRSMIAMILNKNYAIRVFPNSNNLRDGKGAELAVHILRDMDDANDNEFHDEIEDTCLWMITTGVGFNRSYPDKGGGGWFVDAGKNIITTGEVASESVSPFSMVMDHLGTKLKKKRYVGMKSLKPVEWVEDTFHVKVKPDDNDMMMSYQKRLMKFVANVSRWKGAMVDTSLLGMRDDDLCIFYEVEFKPTIRKPNGRYVGKAGGKVLFDLNRMPIEVEDGRWEYTWTDFHYRKVPGRYWSDGGINDQISPQNSINQIDQALEMNRRGLGRPWASIPKDCGIELKSKKGHSFLAITYDPLLSGGAMPQIHRGTPLPQQVLEERAIHKATSEDASGNPKRILSGNAPNSQASGVLVDILREAAEQGHTPDIDRFRRAKQRVYRKRLKIAQSLYTEPRMLKIAGEGKDIQVKFFVGADILGNTDVRLEPDNRATATTAGQTAGFTELAKSGAISPEVLQDPNIQRQILERYNLSAFNETKDIDVTRAEKENATIAAMSPEDAVDESEIKGIFLTVPDTDPDNPEILNKDELFLYDNHQAHFETHRRFILSDEFSALDPVVQEILRNHINAHNNAIKQQHEEQMAMEMAMQNRGLGVESENK